MKIMFQHFLAYQKCKIAFSKHRNQNCETAISRFLINRGCRLFFCSSKLCQAFGILKNIALLVELELATF